MATAGEDLLGAAAGVHHVRQNPVQLEGLDGFGQVSIIIRRYSPKEVSITRGRVLLYLGISFTIVRPFKILHIHIQDGDVKGVSPPNPF